MAKELIQMDKLWEDWEEALQLGGMQRGESLIRQQLSLLCETEYLIELEWLPESWKREGADERNPPGTVTVVLDARTRGLCSYHTVRHDEPKSRDSDVNTPAVTLQAAKACAWQWIERFAGLTEKAGSVELASENQDQRALSFYFRQTREGIPFYPSMLLHIKVGRDGQVISYANYGTTHAADISFRGLPGDPPPSPVQVRQAALEAFELIYAPESSELPSWLYGVEETFLDAATGDKKPYELQAPYQGTPPLNRPLLWDKDKQAQEKTYTHDQSRALIGERMERAAASSELRDAIIDWEAVHPDAEPISPDEVERVYESICVWGHQKYPGESGQWMLGRVLRKSGLLVAVLERNNREYRAAFRTKVLIDPDSFAVISDISFGDLPRKPEELLTKEQAFNKIADTVTSKPYYVWEEQKREYRLMYLIDCPFVIDACSGERVE